MRSSDAWPVWAGRSHDWRQGGTHARRGVRRFRLTAAIAKKLSSASTEAYGRATAGGADWLMSSGLTSSRCTKTWSPTGARPRNWLGPRRPARAGLAARHTEWIAVGWGGRPVTADELRGLAEMYVADDRFSRHYGGAVGATFRAGRPHRSFGLPDPPGRPAGGRGHRAGSMCSCAGGHRTGTSCVPATARSVRLDVQTAQVNGRRVAWAELGTGTPWFS